MFLCGQPGCGLPSRTSALPTPTPHPQLHRARRPGRKDCHQKRTRSQMLQLILVLVSPTRGRVPRRQPLPPQARALRVGAGRPSRREGAASRHLSQVVPPPGYQVAPAMLLRVVQGEAVPGQCHELRCDPHLEAEETGARGPGRVIEPGTQLPIPPVPPAESVSQQSGEDGVQGGRLSPPDHSHPSQGLLVTSACHHPSSLWD